MTAGPQIDLAALKVLGIAYDYDEILQIFRERGVELGASRATIDEVSGLPSGYSAKVLSTGTIKRAVTNGKTIRNSVRSLGRTSWGPMLGAHAMAIVFVEDVRALKQIASRLVKRNDKMDRASPAGMPIELIHKMLRAIAKSGGRARFSRMTSEQITRHQRRAARARWRKARAARLQDTDAAAAR